MIPPHTHSPPPSRSNLEDSVLIRNVLKSQRRERGDHTVLMNRDRGISSNLHLYLHLISPSAHTHSPSPFICLCFLLFSIPSQTLFPFSFFPFCLSAHASLCLFFSYKFLDYLVFISNFPLFFSFSPPPSAPPSFTSASAPLGSCVLVGVVGGLALCRARSVSAALAHPSAHPAPWSLINESSVVFVYRPVIC